MDNIKALILAAGKGTRLKTEGALLPKVMREANGRPLLGWVLDTLSFIPKEDSILVVGYMREQVLAAFTGYPHAVQDRQIGTGHAVMCAAPLLEGFNGSVLVCYGDMPLVSRESYESLCRLHFDEKNACTLLSDSSGVERPGYGRVIRGKDFSFERIVEEKDCTPEESDIREYNSGVYVFDCASLLAALKELRPDNAQAEYYLTDVPAIMLSKGLRVGACSRELGDEIMGVNTAKQLGEVEALLKRRKPS